MNIAYVDDSSEERAKALPLFMNKFQEFHIPVERFDFFENGESFLAKWHADAYDLIILDIYMGKLSGVDVANEIRKTNKEVRIVFCSTSNEFAGESYDVNACYYIQKPVQEKAIAQMIARLNIENYELRRFITLPDSQKIVLRNMQYAEYSNHQIEIHNRKGPGIKCWMSFSSFCELFKEYDFFLVVNSGCLVNMWEISELEADTVIMKDSTVLTVSRRKKADVKARYQAFLIDSVKKGL